MQSRREFLFTLAGVGAVSCVGLALPTRAADLPVKATAITEVFGDGVRFVAVALEIDAEIDAASLSEVSFQVGDRTVTGTYPANSADPSDRSETGRFIIITLDPEDAEASLQDESKKSQGMGAPAGGDQSDSGGPGAGGPGAGGGVGKAGELPTMGYDMYFLDPEATVDAAGTLGTTTGTALSLPETTTSAIKNLVVDDFQQLSFTDEATGDTLPYNLFVPKDYDPSKSYPLVLFMHDAGATSDVTRTTLFQGLGAISWASPEDQAKRPCFVLAPQYATIIVDDTSTASSMLDTTIDLIKALSNQYSIDTNRLYTTGQSGGCMMSIAMNIKYPDFFAASFLVAGQWDPTLVAPLAEDKLFIVVSQDDPGAFPGEIAITEALEAEGARISRAIWDATWSDKQYQFAFDDIDTEQSPINFISFAEGTVFPADADPSQPASGHRNTWRVAYSIEPIREWIFRQHR